MERSMQLLRRFGSNDPVEDPKSARWDGDTLRIEANPAGFIDRLNGGGMDVVLFEVVTSGLSNSRVLFKASIKTSGEFTSFNTIISYTYKAGWFRRGQSVATTPVRFEDGRIIDTSRELLTRSAEEWTTFEVEDLLAKAPKSVMLVVGYVGKGLILMKDIEVLYSPRS
jgi:hypothetical protein